MQMPRMKGRGDKVDGLQQFLALLAERAPTMTKGQLSVAEQIARDPAAIAFSSADELAAAAGVGQTTVIRTAHELGFDGYAALQKFIRSTVRARRLDRYEAAVAALTPGGGAAHSVLRRVLEADMDNLRRTLERIPEAHFEQAVDMLATSRRIFIAGFRAAFSTAHFFAYTLSGVKDNVVLFESDTYLFSYLAEFTPDTAVVGISFPRYTKKTLDIMTFAKQRGCKTIGITENPISPIGKIADVVLTAEIGSPAATDSHTAALSLVTALQTGVAIRLGERASQSLQKIEATMQEWQQISGDTHR